VRVSLRVKRAQVIIVIILALALAAILYLAFIVRSRRQQLERYRGAYAGVKVGDSREAVVAAMGRPHEIIGCPYTPFADAKQEAEFRSNCFQQYRYTFFMREYTFSFDSNGAVIGKGTAVSP